MLTRDFALALRRMRKHLAALASYSLTD
jgi:hypothetical protein